MRKNKLIIICVCVFSLLTGCTKSSNTPAESASSSAMSTPASDFDAYDSSASSNDSNIVDISSANEYTPIETNGVDYEAQAKDLIQKAFAYDVSDCTPEISNEDQITLTYQIEDNDLYFVGFQPDMPYPKALYHFCHANEQDQFDLSSESDEYYKDDMSTIAMDFIQQLYGVDCTDAEIHAYGYSNKIAVQLEVSSDLVFSVRFYYKDLDPVGVLFTDDIQSFQKIMETNNAKQYF